MYRCSVTVMTNIAVEAASLAEAERKIDDVLQHADEIHIKDPIDQLTGSRGSITRSRIQVEN
jgi:hypothetical protein